MPRAGDMTAWPGHLGLNAGLMHAVSLRLLVALQLTQTPRFLVSAKTMEGLQLKYNRPSWFTGDENQANSGKTSS